jgi:hypothetical protein
MTAQCGPVLDLDGLLRVGFLVGGGNKPNDHYFGMTTLGIDLVSWKKMLFKPKPGPGPFDDVTDYPVTLIFRTAGRPPAE